MEKTPSTTNPDEDKTFFPSRYSYNTFCSSDGSDSSDSKTNSSPSQPIPSFQSIQFKVSRRLLSRTLSKTSLSMMFRCQKIMILQRWRMLLMLPCFCLPTTSMQQPQCQIRVAVAAVLLLNLVGERRMMKITGSSPTVVFKWLTLCASLNHVTVSVDKQTQL